MKNKILTARFRPAIVGLLFAALCAIPSAHAVTLLPSSTSYAGIVDPGVPASPSDVVVYVNTLMPLAVNTSQTISGQAYTRSGNTFPGAPVAVLTGNTVFSEGNLPSSINVSGWTYISLKYD